MAKVFPSSLAPRTPWANPEFLFSQLDHTPFRAFAPAVLLPEVPPLPTPASFLPTRIILTRVISTS